AAVVADVDRARRVDELAQVGDRHLVVRREVGRAGGPAGGGCSRGVRHQELRLVAGAVARLDGDAAQRDGAPACRVPVDDNEVVVQVDSATAQGQRAGRRDVL